MGSPLRLNKEQLLLSKFFCKQEDGEPTCFNIHNSNFICHRIGLGFLYIFRQHKKALWPLHTSALLLLLPLMTL